MLRAIFAALAACLLAFSAVAEEKVNRFDVGITVQADGDILVSETITVFSEGDVIRRGIFRDLPRFYADDAHEGDKLPYQYNVRRVMRDGNREPYETETDGNAFRIRIGDPDVFITYGEHTYEIQYEVKNQIRYFGDHDELYWNVTGNYWLLPIDAASVRITLPEGARVTSQSGYTGGFGEAGSDYVFRETDGAYEFEATRPLGLREGLTVSLSLAKGAIKPPSLGDKGMLWWFRHGALAALLVSFLGVLGFLFSSFQRVGQDPPKPPVFPRYEPPAGYSPAAAHHIYYRGFKGHTALVSTLMNMGVKGLVDIDASDKKATVLTRKSADKAVLTREDAALETSLFAGSPSLTLGKKYNAEFTAAYLAFQKAVAKTYGKDYFRWNIGYTLAALVLTVLAIIFAVSQAVNWTMWHTLVVLAFAAINGLFMYLMPAPTPKGQDIRSEISGFRLYLETAEKLQMNAVQAGSGAPPPMSVERYEAFLPYAMALDVEKPWTKYFEKQLPEVAEHYSPAWGHFGDRSFRNIGGMNEAILSSMNTGVSSSLPQSSSSSGSGGGGFSGGGGGGAGGGGW
ncbi:DUF2207 domain-containing protein [Hyphomonas sp.]|uniref:DUF2207 domain-containing protein n=1 Tax=Hyphomonas sp. TaxID=87 RepID=UPI0025B7D4AB|nr:DUF2207 domain-containing protein [Hyphomonas sp.]MBI1401308.1 DUF2207 domain-containing protein [Hyphomonas sp.]